VFDLLWKTGALGRMDLPRLRFSLDHRRARPKRRAIGAHKDPPGYAENFYNPVRGGYSDFGGLAKHSSSIST